MPRTERERGTTSSPMAAAKPWRYSSDRTYRYDVYCVACVDNSDAHYYRKHPWVVFTYIHTHIPITSWFLSLGLFLCREGRGSPRAKRGERFQSCCWFQQFTIINLYDPLSWSQLERSFSQNIRELSQKPSYVASMPPYSRQQIVPGFKRGMEE